MQYCLREQLEEGEIVDDDFEDISDNSIDTNFGKCVSPNEHLHAVSLSSDNTSFIIKNKKKILHRKNKIKHKKRKHRRIVIESSDSDNESLYHDCNPVLKGQLKEAVHIKDPEVHKETNTLEARLRGMIAPLEPPAAPLESSDKIEDSELENLRTEALKTAFINKCQRRKKKVIDNQADKAPEVLNDKENDTPDKNQNGDAKPHEAPILDLEDDEDLLRAALLAGLAKKIAQTSVETVAPKTAAPTAATRPRNQSTFNVNRMKKPILKIPKPMVKPLIINVNADSDSDEETFKLDSTQDKSKVPDLKVISHTVEQFLREQRAKFEKSQPIKRNAMLEKSSVKLLPKSQQVEYHQLLKRLKTAERKKRMAAIRNARLKPTIQILETGEIKLLKPVLVKPATPKPVLVKPATSKPVLVKTPIITAATPVLVKATSATAKPVWTTSALAAKPVLGKTLEAAAVNPVWAEPTVAVKPMAEIEPMRSSETASKKAAEPRKRVSGLIRELTTLKKTLRDIRIQRSVSLQIKNKYQVLTPVIKNITETSNKRKKEEQRIKRLQQELSEARSNLSKSHQQFSNLVKELVAKKETIEKSIRDEALISAKRKNPPVISAPVTLVTSTPMHKKPTVVDECTVSTIVANSSNHESEDMDVCNSDEDECHIDIVDPNDIDQIFKRRTVPKCNIPEYVSPLNLNSSNRYRNMDPLGIMCPYEVNGSCRDLDCSFKHYPRNQERQ